MAVTIKCPVPVVSGTNWNVSCQPVALRAAQVSHILLAPLLAHQVALPAQAQIAAVVIEST